MKLSKLTDSELANRMDALVAERANLERLVFSNQCDMAQAGSRFNELHAEKRLLEREMVKRDALQARFV